MEKEIEKFNNSIISLADELYKKDKLIKDNHYLENELIYSKEENKLFRKSNGDEISIKKNDDKIIFDGYYKIYDVNKKLFEGNLKDNVPDGKQKFFAKDSIQTWEIKDGKRENKKIIKREIIEENER